MSSLQPTSARIPLSTYRVQFSRAFTFRDASAILPYLHELGISDLYASPYLKARSGSLHGYDVVDPGRLNPEVGSEEEYGEMVGRLQELGMGQLLDIVPNHMGIACPENIWWADVLENGPAAVHAPFFDINWEPVTPELQHRVLIPVLGDQYGNVLERGELRLTLDEGAFWVSYYDNAYPIRPRSYRLILEHRIGELKEELGFGHPDLMELLSIITQIRHLPLYTEVFGDLVTERYREKEVAKRRLSDLLRSSPAVRAFLEENVRRFNGDPADPSSFDLMDRLLSEQIFRLSHWRVATEEINYRRFFDINEMAAVRAERPVVFRETHSLVLRLIREGKVTGLRVDHPDGLYAPLEYFHRLQQACFAQLMLAGEGSAGGEERERLLAASYGELVRENPSFRPFYIACEKILMPDEQLPQEWPIHSTTGYIFSHYLNGLFVETVHEAPFDAIYASFTGNTLSFPEVAYRDKKLIMSTMSSEINMLGHSLYRIAQKDRHTRDFTLNSLTAAITETIAFFPVYRTYISSEGVTDTDRRYVELAVARAREKNPAVNRSVYDFLQNVLLLHFPGSYPEEGKGAWLDFVMKFQQVTGPFMAKGLEDTAFYVYNRLISLNDVGGNPARFGESMETFHRQNLERSRSWPHSLLASSTHDSKRGEDVRARINVISEIPAEWEAAVTRWRELNAGKGAELEGRRVPDSNEEYLLYQTMVGVSPAGPMDNREYDELKSRVKEYMLKAVREGKRNSSWINPDPAYEEALLQFVDRVMGREPQNAFLYEFEQFLRRVQPFGLYNSLAQALLKATSPGVPDFYQGTETWSYTLVDPDNRRPVDYSLRREMLERLKLLEARLGGAELARELLLSLHDGRIKMFVTWKTLRFRREHAALFRDGDYRPLKVAGEAAGHVCAFARRCGDQEVIVAVPRFLIRLVEHPSYLPVGREVWGDYFLVLGEENPHPSYRNIFTGETVSVFSRGGYSAIFLSELFATFPLALLERVPA